MSEAAEASEHMDTHQSSFLSNWIFLNIYWNIALVIINWELNLALFVATDYLIWWVHLIQSKPRI